MQGYVSGSRRDWTAGRFECLMCGKCCTLKIEPSKEDIKRIEGLGYRKNEFMDGKYIRQKNNACIFLKKEGNHYKCSIYDYRPMVCRNGLSQEFSGRCSCSGMFFHAQALKKSGMGYRICALLISSSVPLQHLTGFSRSASWVSGCLLLPFQRLPFLQKFH